MTDKLKIQPFDVGPVYTQKEVDDLQRLARAEAALPKMSDERFKKLADDENGKSISVGGNGPTAMDIAKNGGTPEYIAQRAYTLGVQVGKQMVRAEAAAVMNKIAEEWRKWGPPEPQSKGKEVEDMCADALVAAIPTDYADALREREQKAERNARSIELRHVAKILQNCGASWFAEWLDSELSTLRSEPAGKEPQP